MLLLVRVARNIPALSGVCLFVLIQVREKVVTSIPQTPLSLPAEHWGKGRRRLPQILGRRTNRSEWDEGRRPVLQPDRRKKRGHAVHS